MKKKLFTVLMIFTLAASIAGCGGSGEETPAGTDDGIDAMTVEIDTEVEITTAAETETVETTAAAETKNTAEEMTAVISEEEAGKLLLKEFGAVDEASGDKNVFIYEKVVTVDGVDYYSYRWEAGDGTYLCNAFVRTDGTDAVTGIYSNGKWELGSDFGSDDSDDGDMEYEEEYDDSDDVPFDDGFDDVDSEGEEPVDDAEIDDEIPDVIPEE